MRRRTRLVASAVTVALAVVAASAVTAGAANGIKRSDYPPASTAYASSTFKIGVTCLLSPLTCPDPNYSQPATGGQGGGGDYLRIGYTQLIPAVADIYSLWGSTAFHYTGAQGNDPTELSLSLYRKFHCAFPGVGGCALVDPTIGNEVRYSVDILDSNGDIVAQPIDNRLAKPTDSWTRVEGSIDPDDLPNPGDYTVVIVTEVKTTAQVLPDPNTFVGYDSVDLKAKFNPAEVGGGGGGGGGGGRQTIFKHWKRLIVKAKCPKSLNAHSCMIHLVSYAHGFSGPSLTPHKTVRRRGTHLRRITLRVRPKYNSLAATLKRVHVHMTAKAHHHQISKNTTLPVVALKKP
jgi:hypothetical protein